MSSLKTHNLSHFTTQEHRGQHNQRTVPDRPLDQLSWRRHWGQRGGGWEGHETTPAAWIKHLHSAIRHGTQIKRGEPGQNSSVPCRLSDQKRHKRYNVHVLLVPLTSYSIRCSHPLFRYFYWRGTIRYMGCDRTEHRCQRLEQGPWLAYCHA